MKKSFLCFLFLSVFILSCSKKEIPKDWKKFNEDGISISYPSDWSLKNARMNEVFSLSPKKLSKDDVYAEHVMLTVSKLPSENASLNNLKSFFGKSLEKLRNTNIIINQKFTNDLGDYLKIIYTTERRGRMIKAMQCNWIISNKIYSLSFRGDSDDFQKYEDNVSIIFDSFTVNK